jgi:hypothetical protein
MTTSEPYTLALIRQLSRGIILLRLSRDDRIRALTILDAGFT